MGTPAPQPGASVTSEDKHEIPSQPTNFPTPLQAPCPGLAAPCREKTRPCPVVSSPLPAGRVVRGYWTTVVFQGGKNLTNVKNTKEKEIQQKWQTEPLI